MTIGPVRSFVDKSLTLDLISDGNDRGSFEWIVETQADRILYLAIQSADGHPLLQSNIASLLTVFHTTRERLISLFLKFSISSQITDADESILFPLPGRDQIAPIYSKSKSVHIRINQKQHLHQKLQLKIEKV